jgi:hypothetical protein
VYIKAVGMTAEVTRVRLYSIDDEAEKAEKEPQINADQRRSTQIENSIPIRVHPRSSAVHINPLRFIVSAGRGGLCASCCRLCGGAVACPYRPPFRVVEPAQSLTRWILLVQTPPTWVQCPAAHRLLMEIGARLRIRRMPNG